MAVMSLFNTACPTLGSQEPSAIAGRARDAKRFPRMTIGRMLQNATPAPQACKSRREATGIVAEFVLMGPARRTMPVSAPTFARGMRDDRVRAGIESGIPFLVPGIDARATVIAASALHEESRDHGSEPITCR